MTILRVALKIAIFRDNHKNNPWGCPGFDGIGKACVAGEAEGPLN